MNRRQFLKYIFSAASVAGWGGFTACSSPVLCPVTILPVDDYAHDMSSDIASVMSRDGLTLKNKKVLLKPNFVEAHANRPINTNIAVIAAAAQACLQLGAREVIIGEASGHRRDPWFSVLNPALRAIIDKRVRCIDLNYADVASVKNKGSRTGIPNFYLPREIVEADVLINMPKLKTHHWMGVTLCNKNLFGTLPGVYYGWPKNVLHYCGIENSILDLAQTVRTHYNIIDGIVGMEGDGPIMGNAKQVGALILSAHPLAADATAARIMGFDPRKIPYLASASRFLPGLNEKHILYPAEHPRRYAAHFACLDKFKSMQGDVFW